jgi:hypothetical protein
MVYIMYVSSYKPLTPISHRTGPYFAVQLFLVILSTNCAEGVSNKPLKRAHGLSKAQRKALEDGQVPVSVNREKPKPPTGLAFLRAKVKRVAKSQQLQFATLFIILLNTACMALTGICDLETDPRCPDFKAALEVLNVIFTVLFALEFVVKLLGLGPLEYFSSGANCLDFIIVVSSLVEFPGVIATMTCYLEDFDPAWEGQTVQLSAGIAPAFVLPHLEEALTVPRTIKSADGALGVNPLQYFACENGGGFMTVLRAFRLVRLVKLLKGFPEIQKQLGYATSACKAARKDTSALLE